MKIRNSLFAERDNTKVSKLQRQMNILNSLCISYDELKNAPKTLRVCRKLEESKMKEKV